MREAVPSRHYAARMAAKEAVAKILPSGWAGPLQWRSIEILGRVDGRPSVVLTGRPLTLATTAGITDIGISLSHCDEYAAAVAFTREGVGGGEY